MQRCYVPGAVLLLCSLMAGGPLAAAPSTSTPPPAPKVVEQAVGEMDPFAFSWLDTVDGRTGPSDGLADQVLGIFAGATYRIQDNREILIGQIENNQFNPYFIVSERHKAGGNQYVFHSVARSGKSLELLDGSIRRDAKDPTQGLVILTLHFFSEAGDIGTTYLEQRIQFQKLIGP
jgi:hypothetical protein